MEVMVIKIKHYQPKNNFLNNLKKSDIWKILLKVVINFLSAKDTDEERVMYSRSHKKENMIDDKTDEIINELFYLLLFSYQIGLEESIVQAL